MKSPLATIGPIVTKTPITVSYQTVSVIVQPLYFLFLTIHPTKLRKVRVAQT